MNFMCFLKFYFLKINSKFLLKYIITGVNIVVVSSILKIRQELREIKIKGINSNLYLK